MDRRQDTTLTQPERHGADASVDPAPAGAVVVTTQADGAVYGVTARSMSLLTNPLMVSVAVDRQSPLVEMARRSRCFAASLLTEGQRPVAGWFSPGRGPEPRRFARVASTQQATGAPVIAYCLSWYDCEVDEILLSAGSAVLLGRVVAVGGGVGEPMLQPATSAANPAAVAHAAAAPLLALDAPRHEFGAARQGVLTLLASAAVAAGHPARWSALDDLAVRPPAAVGGPLDPATSRWSGALDLIGDAAGNRPLLALALSLTSIALGGLGDQVPREPGNGVPNSAAPDLADLTRALQDGDAAAAAALLARHLGG